MKMIEQIFTIHPIGQGLFYSCTLKIRNKVRFRMVFDCGSKTAQAGQAEVAEYRKDPDYLNVKVLDLLVISHFDADHVNHIKKLLADGVIVKNLVMPFITFEERLFLIARLAPSSDSDEDWGGIVDFILDPLEALSDHLDMDSEIFLVESDEVPIPESPDSEEYIPTNLDEEIRANFEFEGKNVPLVESDLNAIGLSAGKGKIFKIKDSYKGVLSIASNQVQLMEFLFYKKKIGSNQNQFYNALKSEFDKFYIKNKEELKKEDYLAAVLVQLKDMSSATKWEPLIQGVVTKITSESTLKELGIDKSLTDLIDLNTTALCMLHKNLKGLYNQSKSRKGILYLSVLATIQKFGTKDVSRIETLLNRRRELHSLPFEHFSNLKYPNTLLTSDTFLLKEEDINPLLSKYKYHWNNFWMVQVPHHGSKKNSNQIFLSQIPSVAYLFINYGTKNRDKHPDHEVITDIVASGHSSKLISVNEFTGFKFSLFRSQF